MWLKSPNITCKHGFSTRHGGVSPAPFNSLNLGGSQDEPSHIETNRSRAMVHFNAPLSKLCILKQVHGTTVCQAVPGTQEGDALVSNVQGQALAVSIADCYPILYYDAVNKIVGVAHAGWRGTLGKIAAKTVAKMLVLGANLQTIQVAIGPGISKKNFEVGPEVLEQFKKAGFPKIADSGNRIDLAAYNKWVLMEQGIPEKNIWIMNRCTFEDDFFSYRRDRGVTGRMWGLITM